MIAYLQNLKCLLLELSQFIHNLKFDQCFKSWIGDKITRNENIYKYIRKIG